MFEWNGKWSDGKNYSKESGVLEEGISTRFKRMCKHCGHPLGLHFWNGENDVCGID